MNKFEAKINNGYIDYVFAFKAFNNDECSYEEFIKRLKNSKITISKQGYDNSQHAHTLSFKDDFISYINKRYKEFQDEKVMKPDYFIEDFNKNEEKYIKITPIDTGDVAVDVISIDELETSQESFLNSIVASNTFQAGYYNRPLNSVKTNFMVQPFKYKLSNISYYSCILMNVYRNGMATIRVALHIADISIEELSGIQDFINFDNVYMPKFIENKGSQERDYVDTSNRCKVQDVILKYIKYIQSIEENISSKCEIFTHITLLDYGYQPKDLKGKPSNNFNNMLYKILFAPIDDFTEQEEDKIDKEINQRYYSMTKYLRHYISSSARSISIYSKEIDELVKKFNCNIATFYFSAIDSILPSIEYILLERYLYEEFLLYKLNTDMSITELRELKLKLLDEDKFFFLRYGFGYGSLKELLEFMEKVLNYYLQFDLIEKRSSKVQELIKLKEDQKKERFNIVTRLAAMLLTIILSLPAIKSITSIFNESGYFIPSSVTLLIWLEINVVFLVIILLVYRHYIVKKANVIYKELSRKCMHVKKEIKTRIKNIRILSKNNNSNNSNSITK